MSAPPARVAGPIRRVLVRAPNWLGDTVMALPLLRALRGALPDATLCCLGPWAEPLLEAEPGIERPGPYPRGWPARFRAARRLAPSDVALVLPNSFAAAVEARLAGARARVGYAADGRGWLLTHALPAPAGIGHQAAEFLGLLRPLGIGPALIPAMLHVAPGRRAEARRLLAEVAVAPGAGVGIQLGAAFGGSKLWPPARLGELAARLEEARVPAVFLGAPGAVDLLRGVREAMGRPARSLVGRDHPALLPALLAEFAVVVSPDSGPAHVAAATGVPVVALFGPTDPRRTAPLGDGHAVIWRRPPCAPCFQPRCPIDHRCLGTVTVDEVFAAVLDRLAASRPAAALAGPS